MSDTNPTEDRKRAFAALRSGDAANFCLFSCLVNGEPAAAISAVTPLPSDTGGADCGYRPRPLFVSVTPGMRLADRDGCEPSQAAPLRAFATPITFRALR